MADIVNGLDGTANCPTYCSLTTLNDLPAKCADDDQECGGSNSCSYCSCGAGQLMYIGKFTSNPVYQIDTN